MAKNRIIPPQGGSGTTRPALPQGSSGTAAPRAADGSVRVYDVEIGFPGGPVPTVYQVEASSPDEAFEILTHWFRKRLRVVGDRPMTRKGA